MRQRSENFNPAGTDPEATLITPRFDEREARRAHPVVPLAEAPPRNVPRATRRTWTNTLLAVALLSVAALGGALFTKFMQDSRAARTQEQTRNEQTQPIPAAPVQTAEAPSQPSAPPPAEATREEAPPAAETTREARTRRARAAATLPESEPDEVEVYEDERRRGRRAAKRAERRREREEEAVEKEMRKASKRAKDGGSRLVDVLTNSPRTRGSKSH